MKTRFGVPALTLIALLAPTGVGAAPDAPPSIADSLLQHADLIRTNHGNILIGRLMGGARGILRFGLVDVEQIELRAMDVAELRAGTADFQVDIERFGRLVGRIGPAERAGEFTLRSGSRTVTARLTDIILLKRVELELMERLDGFVGGGYSFTDASNIGRLHLQEFVSYGTHSYSLFEYGTASYTFGVSSGGADQAEFGVGGMVGFRGRWLGVAYFQFQHLPASGVAERWLSVTGGGVRLAHNRWLDLTTATGIALQRERTVSGSRGELQSKLPLYLEWTLGFPLHRLELESTSTFFWSLSVAHRRRIDHRVRLDLEPVEHLRLGMNATLNYDSSPLESGSDQMMRSTFVTVGYSF